MSNLNLSPFIKDLSPHATAALGSALNAYPFQEPHMEDISSLDFYTPNPIFATVLTKFSKSIQLYGILTPVIICPDTFKVTNGIKRCKAASMLSFEKIPCVYAESSAKSSDERIIELIRAKTLHYFDEALLINLLVKIYLYSQEGLASMLGVSQSYVANKLRLLRFTESERDAIRHFSLPERTSRAILRISDIASRIAAAEFIHSASLSVSAAEKYIDYLITHSPSSSGDRAARRTANSIERLIEACAESGGEILVKKQEDNDFIKFNIAISKRFT